MALFRCFSQKVGLSGFIVDKRITLNSTVCIRMLNYSAIKYDGDNDPAPLFFNKEIQSLLKVLTRVDLAKVFKKKRLNDKKLEDPEYRFMTNEELQKEMEKARRKIDSMLQMPPVINVRKPINQIFSKDPALQGLETSRMVFTDITFGVKDRDRLIVVREPDGTLREAECELKRRINQLYFPKTGRSIVPPRLFEDSYLESLLNRQEYEFILDSACMQFEPDDPDYQRVVSIVYQHINDNNNFEILRSTRHFGVLTFFLVWNKSIDNLLLDLIETAHIEEAGKLIDLYYKVHNESVTSDSDLEKVDEYVRTFSNKKGALELSLQAYKDLARQREELEKGIKIAHGLN